MIKTFALNPDQIRVREILNKRFLEIEIYAISNADPNRNKSCFTDQCLDKVLSRFTNKPILGFFNKSQDFEEHNAKISYDPEMDREYWDTTNGEQILGFIRESDQKEIVEKDGLLWIRCTAMICTQYNYRQVKCLLKDKRKKVSVEVEIFESESKNGIEYIYDCDLLGITILGSKGGVPIQEGIEGAHLSVLDLIETQSYQSQKQAITFAYNQLNNQEVSTLAKDDLDTKAALKVDKSKDAVSSTEWGEVDKTALRNRVVAASNFKTVAKDVFLDLREGWEEGEVSKMKYPVMQLKGDDEVVYNRGGLASAKGYAEKNHDEEVLKKLAAIYEHLGLNADSETYSCEGFCELYEDDDDDHGHEPDDGDLPHDDESHDDDHPHDDSDDHDDDESHDDDHKEPNTHAAEDVTVERDFEKECGELRMKCEDYEARCAEYGKTIETQAAELEKCKDYDEVKAALESANAELASMKCAQEEKKKEEQLSYIDNLVQKLGLMEKEVEEVKNKCNACKFSDNAEIEKEIGFIHLQKTLSAHSDQSARFAADIPDVELPKQKTPREKADIRTRLKENIHKGE